MSYSYGYGSSWSLAGAFLSLSHVWRQDLQQDSAVIVIIIHIGMGFVLTIKYLIWP
jgi:hypothetical protein